MEPVRRRRRWARILGFGLPVLTIVLLVALWSWNWFIPLVEARAGAMLGRPVHIANLHVALGRVTTVTLGGLRVDNPDGFAPDPPYAAAERVAVRVDVMAYLRDRAIVIPDIAVDRPSVQVLEDAAGLKNYALSLGADPAGEAAPDERDQAGPKIGAVRVTEGRARVDIPRMRAAFDTTIVTREPEGQPAQIVVEADGRYAGQPIRAQAVGGAVLSLRDVETPWPIDLRVQNGPTRVTLVGTLQNPLQFAGADLRLDLQGPDMTLLQPLIGVPIPATPPYRVTGRFDFAEGRFRLRGMEGRIGRSDINGDIAVAPGAERPDVVADLHSRRVDLDDLAGFIGSQPGRAGTPGQTPQQRAAVARAEASPRLLPTTPINLPRLRAADIHLKYKGARIDNAAPLERLDVVLDIVDGVIHAHPLRFGIGTGGFVGDIRLTPRDDQAFRAEAKIDIQGIDVTKLLAPTGFRGQGRLGGYARVDATGRSLSDLLGRGDGELTAVVIGGDLSAILVDLSGLQFGRALLSALGVPSRATLRCFVGDFQLRRGQLNTRTFVVDTDSSVINGQGSVDLARERIDLRLRTEAKKVAIGSLPTSIGISGSLKDPGISPDIGELAARGGAAVGLGLLFPPLALLPGISFGAEDTAACDQVLSRAGRR